MNEKVFGSLLELTSTLTLDDIKGLLRNWARVNPTPFMFLNEWVQNYSEYLQKKDNRLSCLQKEQYRLIELEGMAPMRALDKAYRIMNKTGVV